MIQQKDYKEGFGLEYKWTTDLKTKTYRDALRLRKEVFVDEQQVSIEEEIDAFEDNCYHLVAYIDNAAVATGRILPQSEQDALYQRVAVLKEARGLGYGRDLIIEMLDKSKTLGFKEASLHGQDHAIPFYEKIGFQVEGEGYLDAGIPHHTMRKTIDKKNL